jgi:hypothetical protein
MYAMQYKNWSVENYSEKFLKKLLPFAIARLKMKMKNEIKFNYGYVLLYNVQFIIIKK